jgi:polyisoprenoid-binding protein YceI
MEDKLIIAYFFILFGVIALVGNLHQQSVKKLVFYLALTAVGVGLYSFSEITTNSGESNKSPLFLVFSILFSAVFLDFILPKEKRSIRLLIGVSFPFLLLILGKQWFQFGGVNFSGNSLFQVGILGTITPILFHLVFARMNKIDATTKIILELGFFALFIMGSMLASSLLGGQFALFTLFACFFASFTLNHEHIKGGTETSVGTMLSLLLFIILPAFTNQFSLSTLTLNNPSLLIGIVLGAFVISISAGLNQLQSKGIKKSFLHLLILILPISIILLLHFFYSKTGVGGATSACAILIGAGISVIFINAFIRNMAIAPTILLLGSLMIYTSYQKVESNEIADNIDTIEFMHEEIQPEKPYIINEKDSLLQPSITQENVKIEKTGLETKVGKWKIVQNKSKLTFVLGAHGQETEGKFTQYQGSFVIDDKIENSKLSISIPVDFINTDVDERDQNLKEDPSFFDLVNFPNITFLSSKITNLGNNLYSVLGTFTMKGISKKRTLSFSYTENSENSFRISGKGTLDRTLFGMEPDASIGNIVSFQFSTTFIKEQ